MPRAVYGYPQVHGGLGNMLIPWADCVLWCRDNEAAMIAPFWTKIRMGPWLRRERDKRLYHRFFVPAGDIHGLPRLVLLATSCQVTADDWRSGRSGAATDRSTVVCFANMNLFGNLIGRHNEVHAALYRITRRSYHPVGLGGKPFVGIHVRLGDFPQMPQGELLSNGVSPAPDGLVRWMLGGDP